MQCTDAGVLLDKYLLGRRDVGGGRSIQIYKCSSRDRKKYAEENLQMAIEKGQEIVELSL